MRVVLATVLGVLIAGVAFAGTSIDISNSAISANSPEGLTINNLALPGTDIKVWATFQWNGEKGVFEIAKAGPQVAGMVFFGNDCYQQGDTFSTVSTAGNTVVAPEGDSDERPARRVCLFSFYIDQHEVTQADYLAVMGENPSDESGNSSDNFRMPVENVSWDDAKEFCERSKKRLPTEAEWEYAAKSGGLEHRWAGTNDSGQVGAYGWTYENAEFRSRFIMQKAPNQSGLYDMTGNVWEWVSDWYDSNYYNQHRYWDPQGPSTGSLKVIRGGGWNAPLSMARTTQRLGMNPSDKNDHVGFRCAQDPMITKTECVDCSCADYVALHPDLCPSAQTLLFRIGWDDTNDVDLHVVYDNGSGGTETIYWNHRTGSMGGVLNADWNAACADHVTNPEYAVSDAVLVEEVSFVDPPAGTYTLRVCGFEQCRENNGTTPVHAQIFSNGALVQDATPSLIRWDRTGACTDVLTQTVSATP